MNKEQIDDICWKSKKEWEKQAAARTKEFDTPDILSKPLKRPLHRPVLISRAAGSPDPKRGNDIRRQQSNEARRGDGNNRRGDDEMRRDDRRR